MDECKSFLKEIISCSGISGWEEPVREVIAKEWKQYADELKVSKLGNLYAIKRGAQKNGKNRKVLIATHMDGIGMIVHKIVDEFIYFAEVGGLDHRILPGQFVTVHGKDGDYPGLIEQPSANLLPEKIAKGPVPMDYLVIDVGMDKNEILRHIEVGDTISFATIPTEMGADCVAGHSLDNRASVAALTQCLMDLRYVQHDWDVYAVATTQEELGCFGAATAPFDIEPDVAIAVDVTFAKGPCTSGYHTKALESGVSLGYGSDIHPELYKRFKQIADSLNVPNQTDILPEYSGTDAMALQIVMGGYPTMVLSIPLRYMHTPVEVISMKDVKQTGHLLAAFIASADEDLIEMLSWKDEENE